MCPVPRRGLLLAVLVVGGALSSGGLRALASEPAPESLIPRALEFRRKGDDQGALPLLQEAFQKSHSARAAGQLGFCLQGLGQWAEAESYLTIALDSGKDPWVIKNHSVIAEALGVVRSHVGRVEVIGDPPGAEVAINANVVGKLPLPAPVHVSNGEVEVEVHAPGYAGKTKSFHIDGGQYQRVVLRLEPQSRVPVAGPQPVNRAALAIASESAAPSSSPSASPVASSPVASSEEGARDGIAKEDAVSSGHETRHALKWIAWGASAVGAGVGIYGVVKNRSGVASFGTGCGLDAMGAPHADTAGTTDAQCIDRKNAYESATKVAVVGFVGAMVLAAAGFALWATEPGGSSGGTVAWGGCLPSVGSGREPGVGCILRF